MNKQKLIADLAKTYLDTYLSSVRPQMPMAVHNTIEAYIPIATIAVEKFWSLVEALENMSMFDNPITRRQTNDIGGEALKSCRDTLGALKELES